MDSGHLAVLQIEVSELVCKLRSLRRSWEIIEITDSRAYGRLLRLIMAEMLAEKLPELLRLPPSFDTDPSGANPAPSHDAQSGMAAQVAATAQGAPEPPLAGSPACSPQQSCIP